MEKLSTGAIARIKGGDNQFEPVLKVTQIKAVNAADAGAQVRYRISVTDGVDTMIAMTATQISKDVIEGRIKEFSVIKLKSFMVNHVQNQHIMIITAYDLIGQSSSNAAPSNSNPNPSFMQQQQQLPPQQGYQQQQALPSYGGSANPGMVSQVYQPTYTAPTQPLQPPVQAAPTMNPYSNMNNMNPMMQQQYQHPYQAPVQYNSAVVPKTDFNGPPIVPINSINPYSSKWTIQARITAKAELKKWQNAKGEGTVFSIDLLDKEGGEIRGTFFKEAAQKWYGVLEEGKVYNFSGGTLKIIANKQFSNLKNNYEITFNQHSIIEPVHETGEIRSQTFHFVKIASIAGLEANAMVDVVAVVKTFDPEVAQIVSQKQGGKTLFKRDLVLVDDSNGEIKLTLWGDKAASAQYNWAGCPIVAFKGLKVGDFNGKSLSAMSGTSILVNPTSLANTNQEFNQVAHWRACGMPTSGNVISLSSGGGAGGGVQFDPFEKRKTISAIKDEHLGMGGDGKGDYITLKGSVIYIKHDNEPFYNACPAPGCNKKLQESMNGQWNCEKCNKTYADADRRYILNVNVADHTGSGWFTLFNETAGELLGRKAQELFEMKTEGREADYEKVFSDALFTTVVGKVKVKQEMVNDEMRVKNSFLKIEKLDFVNESKQLLDAIAKY